jgi:uncharacterized protein YoaH (UPF0181 family)
MANHLKFSPETVELILTEIARSGCILNACEATKIKQSTFYLWTKKYPEFNEKVERAKEVWRRSQPEELKREAKRALSDYLFNGAIVTWQTEGTETKIVKDANGKVKWIEEKTVNKTHVEKRQCPQWVLERFLGKQPEVLEAIQILLAEGVATQEQARIVAEGIADIESRLKKLNQVAEKAPLN